MKRIFLTLATASNAVLIAALVFGLNAGDASQADPQVQAAVGRHMLIGLGSLTFAAFVHAVLFTYFMGTGRWLEETSRAYHLSGDLFQQSQKLKYGTLPGMTFCLLMLVVTGAAGAAADPATPVNLDGFLGMRGATLHFMIAAMTLSANVIISMTEFVAVSRNMQIIDHVLAEVRRMRLERGLPVE